jgi:Domain of unknown function (DUF1992)
MSLEKFIEDQISKAMKRGEFDDLPGRGQPVDLTAYFQTPENLRICYSILKNGDFTPPEVELLKEIERFKEQLAATSDEEQRKQLNKTIADKSLTLRMMLEKQQRTK